MHCCILVHIVNVYIYLCTRLNIYTRTTDIDQSLRVVSYRCRRVASLEIATSLLVFSDADAPFSIYIFLYSFVSAMFVLVTDCSPLKLMKCFVFYFVYSILIFSVLVCLLAALGNISNVSMSDVHMYVHCWFSPSQIKHLGFVAKHDIFFIYLYIFDKCYINV